MTRPAAPQTEFGATCYRHSGRGTNLRCQNCGKPICSECMRNTPVGYRCPDCAPTSRPLFDDSMVMTKLFIGICVAVYLVQVVMGLSHGQGANAVLNTTNNSIADKGFLNALYTDGITHQWYRVVTSGFLHAGLIHIALNCWFIYVLGQLLEVALGKLRFALLYLTTMIGGAVGALALSAANAGTIGASGAAFGMLGAALVMAHLRRNDQLVQSLLITAVINFAFTLSVSGISVGGHIGGFVTGLVCGWLAYGPLQRVRWAAPVAYVGLAVVLFCVAVFVAHEKSQAFLTASQAFGAVTTTR